MRFILLAFLITLPQTGWGQISNFSLLNEAKAELHEITEVKLMPDGTYSWNQPASTGVSGYNGYCGETAVANLITMLSHLSSPNQIMDVCYDSTPGSRPSTLLQVLHDQTDLDWEVYSFDYGDDAFTNLKNALKYGAGKSANGQAPMAVLIQGDGERQYHWVTVVKVTEQDKIFFNHYGGQYSISARNFLKLWAFSADHESWKRVMELVGAGPYTFIAQAY